MSIKCESTVYWLFTKVFLITREFAFTSIYWLFEICINRPRLVFIYHASILGVSGFLHIFAPKFTLEIMLILKKAFVIEKQYFSARFFSPVGWCFEVSIFFIETGYCTNWLIGNRIFRCLLLVWCRELILLIFFQSNDVY